MTARTIPRARPGRRACVRRGGAYIVALLAATVVSTAGLAAISIATTRARTAALTDDAARAELHARSALEHALRTLTASIRAGRDWRAALSARTQGVTLGDGSGTWELRRTDGAPIQANGTGAIVVHAVGLQGAARHAIEATLVPSGDPYDVLDTALYAGGDISFASLSSLDATKPVGALGDISALLATINAPVEAAGGISGSLYLDAIDAYAPERRMPDSGAIQVYADQAQPISYDALPQISGDAVIENLLLGPGDNPFGPPADTGVYAIDCAGRDLLVRQCRINGTLVIRNPGELILGAGLLIDPPRPYRPALLVEGDATFLGTTTGPSESASGVNFNPVTAPFGGGFDSDRTDSYPASIRGLVYVTGNANFGTVSQHVRGAVVVEGNVRLYSAANLEIEHDPAIADLPAQRFYLDEGGLALDPQSWAWVAP